jgi:hypothetical protein
MTDVPKLPDCLTGLMNDRRIECAKCGALAFALCKCGAPYLPAGKRAAEAVAASPNKSDRMIAEEIGTSPTTVGKARKQLSSGGQLNKRTGKDGKARSQPARKSTKKSPAQAIEDEQFLKLRFLRRDQQQGEST